MLERLFALAANGTTVRREILAGCTTFLTMSAILFVNPDILAQAGIEVGLYKPVEAVGDPRRSGDIDPGHVVSARPGHCGELAAGSCRCPRRSASLFWSCWPRAGS